jgi:DNA-binding CsgD family transcriptional regulator
VAPEHRQSDSRLFDVLADIDDLVDVAALSPLLARLTDVYGLASIAYLGSGITAKIGDGPYLAVTYSQEWIEHYKSRRFIEVDPAVQIGLRRMLPIDWSDFARDDTRVHRLFDESSEFGLGRHGISFPVHGPRGDRGLLSITSHALDRDWQNLRSHYLKDFHLLASHLHNAIHRLEGVQNENLAPLSPRERECLKWIAEGKTYWECARILGLSEHTVRCYLESARHKLRAANTAHAVNKASRRNLLTDIP